MKITPRAVIKDGGQRYNPGVEYEVDDEVGRRFVILGWATSATYTPSGVDPAAGVADVRPNSVRHTVTATEV